MSWLRATLKCDGMTTLGRLLWRQHTPHKTCYKQHRLLPPRLPAFRWWHIQAVFQGKRQCFFLRRRKKKKSNFPKSIHYVKQLCISYSINILSPDFSVSSRIKPPYSDLHFWENCPVKTKSWNCFLWQDSGTSSTMPPANQKSNA